MFTPPLHDCPLCPRLEAFRQENRQKYPEFFNGPVPSFGGMDAELLIVGLAPGLKGANATGRPFTGDYAGIILYNALLKHGFAEGTYQAKVGDIKLVNCRISNAVRCLPPENKPEPSEIRTCNQFLKSEIADMPNLKVILSLGAISHNAVLRAMDYKLSAAKFAHGATHPVKEFTLVSSYHTSRYNINTRTLTEAMFDQVIAKIKGLIS
jgi:uracil-DNA glycosylase family 4